MASISVSLCHPLACLLSFLCKLRARVRILIINVNRTNDVPLYYFVFFILFF